MSVTGTPVVSEGSGLITVDYVKTNFPLWNKYFLDADQAASETVLSNEIALSEAELLEYVSVDEDTITASIRRHLFNIVKYRGFVRIHGDTEFEEKPRIVKDYEASIEKLRAFREGKGSLTGIDLTAPGAVIVNADTQRFDQWFNTPETAEE